MKLFLGKSKTLSLSISLTLLMLLLAGSQMVQSSAPHISARQRHPPGYVPPAAPSSAHLTYQGGPVMHTQKTYAIYWKPAGVTMANSYTTTINQYLSDVGGTLFYNILTQYPDTSGAPLNQSIFGGSWTDTRAYLHAGTSANPLTDADLQNEVVHAISLHPQWQAPGLNTLYLVFTANGIVSCDAPNDCSDNSFCAYHGSFVHNSAEVIYADMPYIGLGTGCTASPVPAGDGDAYAEIDTLGHEQFEAANDPLVDQTAWYDNTNGEIADICESAYGPLNGNHADVILHGHGYKIQKMWSNAANACVLSYGTLLTRRAFLPLVRN
jgi:hypothetical protein